MTSSPARIGVAIITYNSSLVLGECLAGLAALADLRTRVQLDVVVADNDSTDNSVKLAESFPDVQVVPVGRNGGYAAGINAAVSAMDLRSLDGVLVLNPDVRLSADCIPHLTADLNRPDVGIAVPRLLNPDGSLQVSIRREPTVLRALAESLLGGARAGRIGELGELITRESAYGQSQSVAWATGAVMLLSTAVVHQVGPWDESLLLYGEEVEYSLRARDHGFRVWYDAAAVAEHVGGDLPNVPFLYALMTVNRVRVYGRRHGRARSAGFYLTVTMGETLRALRGRRGSRLAVSWLLIPGRRPTELPQRD